MEPAITGRTSYHSSALLKTYIYGYLNRIQSSRHLEKEAQRNVELMWLTGCLMPVFKTIAGFRKDNGKAMRSVCLQFIVLCQQLELFSEALGAIDGSKFKAVNHRDRNFTCAKQQRKSLALSYFDVFTQPGSNSAIHCYIQVKSIFKSSDQDLNFPFLCI